MAQRQEKLDEHVDWSSDKEVYNHIEKDYWNYVENQVGEEYRVEYAADLSADRYGNGFGMPTQKVLHKNQPKYKDHPWNFANFQN